MKTIRIVVGLVMLAVVLVLGTGCCGHDPTRWWEPVGCDCAPCGDPCDLCDPRN